MIAAVSAIVLPLLLLTAQDRKPANPNTIPAGAVQIDGQTYKVKEKDGKTWVYRKTPFGVSRVEEEQFKKQNEAALIKPAKEANVKVTDLGTEYRFERAHAFGVQVWKTKKAALTEDEKTYVEKARGETAAQTAAPAEQKK
jgi:hypothetical protein